MLNSHPLTLHFYITPRARQQLFKETSAEHPISWVGETHFEISEIPGSNLLKYPLFGKGVRLQYR